MTLKELSEWRQRVRGQLAVRLGQQATAKDGGKLPELLVCGGGACVSCGCAAVATALREKIGQRALSEHVKVIETGCVGCCDLGVVVQVMPDSVLYCKVTEKDVLKIVEQHLRDDKVVTELLHKPGSEAAPYRSAAEMPALLAGWQAELKQLVTDADLQALEHTARAAEMAWRHEAERISRLRSKAAPALAAAVTQAMQQLGMAGGRFEVALLAQDEAQSWGLETVEFRVAGHAGSTPRPLAKVASGGELSRLALAIAVTTALGDSGQGGGSVPTLIFDEIDAGVGGTVADSVGRLMKQLGRTSQVLAVTHLAQVAACADRHFVVSKAQRGRQTLSDVQPVEGEARVAEVARMLGGERLSGTAHAQALLGLHAGARR